MSAATRGLTAALAALCLAACATPRAVPPPHRPPPAPAPHRPRPPATLPRPPASPPVQPVRLALADLPGWSAEDHAAAFAAYRATCGLAREPGPAALCARAKSLGVLEGPEARRFLEGAFTAEALSGSGVLTAYFSPIYAARRSPDAEFSAPLRGKPQDLVVIDAEKFDPVSAMPSVVRRRADGSLEAYPERADIEAQPDPAPLAWMRPEELFFLQIQGSGRLVLEDGATLKAAYAANNGRPFLGIANPMRERGLLARDATSGEAIRGWLADHRGPEADAIMRLNPRFVFFSLVPDDGRPPLGAAGLPLPAGRSVAIDRAFHAMGAPLWIVGEAPMLAGAFASYRRLVMALDTGGAIKGQIRADLYLGEGPAAGTEAGRVRHTLRLYRLVPR